MSYFDQWMAADGEWDVTHTQNMCYSDKNSAKSVDCQRVTASTYSEKCNTVTDSPPIFQTFLFSFFRGLEKGGLKCYSVTTLREQVAKWPPYRFHAGDAFEGFPLRWPARVDKIQMDIDIDTLQKLRIIPADEILESANIARRQRSRDLIALMYPSNVDEWTWCEHPDGSWRAHHSNQYGG